MPVTIIDAIGSTVATPGGGGSGSTASGKRFNLHVAASTTLPSLDGVAYYGVAVDLSSQSAVLTVPDDQAIGGELLISVGQVVGSNNTLTFGSADTQFETEGGTVPGDYLTQIDTVGSAHYVKVSSTRYKLKEFLGTPHGEGGGGSAGLDPADIATSLATDDPAKVAASSLTAALGRRTTAIEAGGAGTGNDPEGPLSHLTDAFGSEASRQLAGVIGGSGIVAVRQYNVNPTLDPLNRRHHSVYSAINMHDHSNYDLMHGLGELYALVNGHMYRARHQDPTFRKSVQAPNDELGTQYLSSPPISSAILSKPTGTEGGGLDMTSDTQARYMKNVYVDNPQDVVMYLVYLEVWVHKVPPSGLISDAGDSFRHSDSVSDFHESFATNAMLSRTGTKERLENLSFSPVVKSYVDDAGNVEYGYVNGRVMMCKVGTMAPSGTYSSAPLITIQDSDSHGHVLTQQLTDEQARQLRDGEVASITLTTTDAGHTHNYVITWDGSWYVGNDTNNTHQHGVLIEVGFDGAIPFDKAKAIDGIVDETNVFTLVDEPLTRQSMSKEEYIDTRLPRFRVANLERIIERVPGLDGEGASGREESTANPGNYMQDRDGGELNNRYYSHTVVQPLSDASGRTAAGRGFNDPNVFVARNDKDFVMDGVSVMIPLEITANSPRHGWNPYGFTVMTPADIVASGKTGSSGNPLPGVSPLGYWYLTPAEMYTQSSPSDPADTGQTRHVNTPGGATKFVYSSGLAPFTPDNEQRIRFPCYPVYQEFSYEAVATSQLAKKLDEVGGRTFIDATDIAAAEARGKLAMDNAGSGASFYAAVADNFGNTTRLQKWTRIGASGFFTWSLESDSNFPAPTGTALDAQRNNGSSDANAFAFSQDQIPGGKAGEFSVVVQGIQTGGGRFILGLVTDASMAIIRDPGASLSERYYNSELQFFKGSSSNTLNTFGLNNTGSGGSAWNEGDTFSLGRDTRGTIYCAVNGVQQTLASLAQNQADALRLYWLPLSPSPIAEQGRLNGRAFVWDQSLGQTMGYTV